MLPAWSSSGHACARASSVLRLARADDPFHAQVAEVGHSSDATQRLLDCVILSVVQVETARVKPSVVDVAHHQILGAFGVTQATLAALRLADVDVHGRAAVRSEVLTLAEAALAPCLHNLFGSTLSFTTQFGSEN